MTADAATPSDLSSVEAALGQMLAAVEPLPSERLPLALCLGRALASPLWAPFSLPTFASSAMDGYAIRSSDVATAGPAGPVSLRVAYEVGAGQEPLRPLRPGEAARIFTGAPVPAGADAVVMQEETHATEGLVRIPRALRPGENVRPAGEDLRQGDVALRRGASLGPAELGLAAALGQSHLSVHRCPRVALLTTGDELVEPGQALSAAQIYDSNGPALAGAIADCGAAVTVRERAPDEPAALRAALARCAAADALVTVAGVSVGDRDHVRAALAGVGVELGLWRVAMRPGKPVAFGRWQGRPVLALPGNPVSALVTFEVFGRPLLRALGGQLGPDRFVIEATLSAPIRKPKQLALYCRGRCDGATFFPAPKQGSGLLTSIAGQDALAELPVGCADVEAGARVRVRLLGRRGLGAD